jgi:DNA (cytosine-5)-methyltransferase 1
MPTITAPRFARIALPDLAAVATEQINLTFAEAMRRSQTPKAFTFIDMLCGGGGSSAGLTMAGGHLLSGINHDSIAIATHSRNFPDADHKVADLNHYDMRDLPPGADVLWASVICTEISPAGGRKRSKANPGQLELLEFGPIRKETFERTRATAHDVIRAAELWRFPIICVENVIEFFTDWELFAWWCKGFEVIGYHPAVIMSASSAHLGGEGNDPAPQWRDRGYVAFVRKDLPKLTLSPRPEAYCPACDKTVQSLQVWKDPKGTLTASGRRFLVGKYGPRSGQYFYRCPVRGHGMVEPFVRPATSIIDWSYLGERIGDRAKPLVPTTMARIQRGVDMVAAGLLSPSFLGADGGSGKAGTSPLMDQFHPPLGSFIDTARRNTLPRSPLEPLTAVAAGGNHHGLVVPYRKNNVPTSVGAPFGAISKIDSAGLLAGEGDISLDVRDWHYRMVSWTEQALAQRFPVGYEMAGNQGERTAQAGNAVSCNAAQYLGERFAAILAGREVAA